MKKKSIFTVIALFLVLNLCMLPVMADEFGPDMKVDARSWDRSEGNPMNIIDRDTTTFWHSLWNESAYLEEVPDGEFESAQYDYPQIVIVEFDEVYTLDCIGYMSRSDGGNGTVLEYEFWVSETGTTADFDTDDNWTKVASGEWDEDSENFMEQLFTNVEFDAVKAKAVKFKVLDGVGGWACGAELQFGFTDVGYVPMEGFTPKTAPLALGVVETEAETTETPVVEETTVAEVTEAETTEAPVIEEATVAPTPIQSVPATGDNGMILYISLILFSSVALIVSKRVVKSIK